MIDIDKRMGFENEIKRPRKLTVTLSLRNKWSLCLLYDIGYKLEHENSWKYI